MNLILKLRLLAQAGVQTLCLPAAQETVGTWMHGFGFEAMPEEHQSVARAGLRLTNFPGTTLLCKRLGAILPVALPHSMQLPSVSSGVVSTPAIKLVAEDILVDKPTAEAAGCNPAARSTREAGRTATDILVADGRECEDDAPITPGRSPAREEVSGDVCSTPSKAEDSADVSMPMSDAKVASITEADRDAMLTASSPIRQASLASSSLQLNGKFLSEVPANVDVEGMSKSSFLSEEMPRADEPPDARRDVTPPALAARLRHVQALSACAPPARDAVMAHGTMDA